MKKELLKLKKSTIVAFVVLTVVFLGSGNSWAASISAVAAGSWGTTTTWSGNVVPGVNDDVTINGFAVTVDATSGDVSCNSLVIGVSSSPLTTVSSLSVTTSNKLTVTNALTMYTPGAATINLLAVGTGTIACGSMIITTGTSSTACESVTVSTGTITSTTSTTFGTNNVLAVTGAATLNLGGTSFVTKPTGFNKPGCTINLIGTTASQIPAVTYYNLTNSVTGANVTVAGGITIMPAGTLTINDNTTIDLTSSGLTVTPASFTCQGNGTIKATASSFPGTVGATWSGNINLYKATSTALGGGTFNNVTFSGGGVKSIASGTTVIINGTLSLQGTATCANLGTLTFGPSSTLEYATTAGVTATTNEFPATNGPVNLKINSTGQTFTLPASFSRTLNGNLNLAAGTLSIGANILTLRGSITGSGTLNTTSGTLTFAGTSEQTINGNNFISNTVNNLVISAVSQLTTTGTLNATNLTINSSNARVAGTLLGTLTATNSSVNQYLGDVRNWYISSPVSNAPAPGSYTYYQRDETEASWITKPFISGNTFVPGTGYIALPGATGSTMTFSGGSLNSINVPVAVNLSWSGATSKGYNLIGNPYPCNLTWTDLFVNDDTNAALIEPTIWYRTNAGTVNNSGQWAFQTYNAHTGEAVPIGLTGIIPPMQAFWVLAKAAGTLYLDSKLACSHRSSNPLKARAVKNTDRQRFRLEVSNGKSIDETLVYFDAAAANGYDAYDSPKYSDTNAALEIYTTAGTEQLVINGMKSIPFDTELPLGFTTSQSNAFSIKATEFSNFNASTKVYLKDKSTGTEQDLTDGTTYAFASDATVTSNRFSIVFKAAGVTTENNTPTSDAAALIYKNASNQITVVCKGELKSDAIISVYNTLGKKLDTKKITSTTTVINTPFASGVYVVTVNNGGKSTIQKVILN